MILGWLTGTSDPLQGDPESKLDAEWWLSLSAVAGENGHKPVALASLSEADWQQLLGSTYARVLNMGYVPIDGWAEELARMAGRAPSALSG